MDAEQKLLLEQQLKNINLYDLERLRECFVYELSIEPKNQQDLKKSCSISCKRLIKEREKPGKKGEQNASSDNYERVTKKF